VKNKPLVFQWMRSPASLAMLTCEDDRKINFGHFFSCHSRKRSAAGNLNHIKNNAKHNDNPFVKKLLLVFQLLRSSASLAMLTCEDDKKNGNIPLFFVI
jgi:hypothetical protein